MLGTETTGSAGLAWLLPFAKSWLWALHRVKEGGDGPRTCDLKIRRGENERDI